LADDLQTAVHLAAESLDSGAALAKLQQLVALSHS
jgi:anthranilate phosphoribosyltransferase